MARTNPPAMTAEDPEGRKATRIFRSSYNMAGLGLDRARRLNEDTSFPHELLQLIMRCSMPFKAPQGGRLNIVRVTVDPTRDWQEAINTAGPNTGSDCGVRKVGDAYPPEDGGVTEEEIFIVNFGKVIPNGQYALDWAKPLNLSPAKPRQVFAVGEHKPELHWELKCNPMALVSLVPCSFKGDHCVLRVWWGGARRDVNLDLFDDGCGASYWFAFVHKPA